MVSRRHLMNAASLVLFQAVRGAAADSAVTLRLIGSGGRGSCDAGLLVKQTVARLAGGRYE